MQSKHTRPESPYTISIPMQIKYCTKRAYQRLWNDKTSTITTIVGQIAMGLIIGSLFYGTANNTAAVNQKGGVLFFAILLNALIAISEINTLYAQRPIVEKQASYAFYHPFAEALAGIVADIPVKFMIATAFNIILYFLSGLRRDASAFFIFFLFNFVAVLTVSQSPGHVKTLTDPHRCPKSIDLSPHQPRLCRRLWLLQVSSHWLSSFTPAT